MQDQMSSFVLSDDFYFWHQVQSDGQNIAHTHPGIEIHYCEAGEGYFRTPGVRKQMAPGLVTLIHGPTFHHVFSVPGKKYCRTVAHIPMRVVSTALSFLRIEDRNFFPTHDRPIMQFRPRLQDYVDLTRVYRQLNRISRLDRDRLSPATSLYVAGKSTSMMWHCAPSIRSRT